MALSSILPGALLLPALSFPACSPDSSCTAEVTEARGIYRATVSGTRSRIELKREAIRGACGQLCGAQGSAAALGCVVRCAVDAEDGKIGLRATCQGVPEGAAK